jgi:Putative 2OG-Fe(II) oxygenase
MNAVAPIVMPILATPLGVATIPDAAEFNGALCELFTQRAALGHGLGPGDPLRIRSSDDLMEWPEAPVRRLASAIAGAIYQFVGSVSEISEPQLRACNLESRAWFTLIRSNGRVPATNYPLTTWCAIYCVAAPSPVDGRADSGSVRLYESRLGTSFQDASNAVMRIPYSQAHYAWRPTAGQLVIFPGSLTHEVAPLRAAGELVLVTARFRFVGSGQQGLSRW